MDKTSLGIEFPTWVTAPQDIHGKLTIDLPNNNDAINIAKDCIAVAAASAGFVVILTSPAGA